MFYGQALWTQDWNAWSRMWHDSNQHTDWAITQIVSNKVIQNIWFQQDAPLCTLSINSGISKLNTQYLRRKLRMSYELRNVQGLHVTRQLVHHLAWYRQLENCFRQMGRKTVSNMVLSNWAIFSAFLTLYYSFLRKWRHLFHI